MTISKKLTKAQQAAKDARIRRIGRAIVSVGITKLAREFDTTTWAIYKWRDQGYVPTARLQKFCELTGLRATEVCSPDVAAVLA